MPDRYHPTPAPPKADLEAAYIGEGLSVAATGARFAATERVARRWLLDCGIPIRKSGCRPPASEEKRAQAMKVSPMVGHKTEIVCSGCGETFVEYPSRRRMARKYCTKACSAIYQNKSEPWQESVDMKYVEAEWETRRQRRPRKDEIAYVKKGTPR